MEILQILIPIVASIIGFSTAWFLMVSEKRKESLIARYGEDRGLAKLIISSKWIGAFSMGVFPILVYLSVFPETSLEYFGLGLQSEMLWVMALWTLFLGGIGMKLTSSHARKLKNMEVYPQIRARVWDTKMIRGNLIGWTVYMVGYEIMFRGLLLFPLVEAMGVWPAIAINVVISSATHLQKGLTETLATIPLALIFCALSIYTGSIWIAVIVHLSIALTNTSIALKYHPDIRVIKRTRI